jgi:hypothetical protein
MTNTTKSKRWLQFTGWVLVVYGVIESLDTLIVTLMALGWIPNLFPEGAIQVEPFASLLVKAPVWFIPLFGTISFFRLTAGIGLLKGKRWGFWTAVFISLFTVVWMPPFFPLSVLDGLLLIPVVMGLILSRVSNRHLP